jgi:hypothetical protein
MIVVAAEAPGAGGVTASVEALPVVALELSADPDTVSGNGFDSSLIQARLLDLGGRPFGGTDGEGILFEVADGEGVLMDSEDSEDGTGISTRLTSRDPGRVTVQAHAEGAFPQAVIVVARPPTPGEMPDEYEPDDDIGSSGAIAPNGESQRRTFHHRDDVDWVAIDTRPEFRYAVVFGGSVPVEVNLHDAEGNLLGTLDDGEEFGPGSGASETLYLALTTSDGRMGAYEIGARSSRNATLTLASDVGTIAGDGLDAAEIAAEIRSLEGELDAADDSTRIEFALFEGEGVLSVEAATVTGGIAKTEITSRSPGPLVVEARVDGLPSTSLALVVTPAIALDLHLASGDQGIRESLTPPEPGGGVQVDLAAISGAIGILGFQARLTHDPRLLEFTGFEPTDLMTGAVSILDYPGDGEVEVNAVILDGAAVRDAGSLGQAVYRILEGNIGQTAVVLTAASYGREGGQEVLVIGPETGTVTIGSGIEGENALESFVERYRVALGKREGEAGYDAALDLNSDGRIEVRDFVIFLKGIGD